MLQFRIKPSTRPWGSIRFASQFRQVPGDDQSANTGTATSGIAGSARKPPSILSRLSGRTQSRSGHNPDRVQKSLNAGDHVEAATVLGKPRPRATSFISDRSAQKRDHAAEKWFTGVRELDIDNVDQTQSLKSLPRKKRMRSPFPRQHEMRPRTDLNALFALPTVRSATALRVQARRQLGGDYASYLPHGYVDPYQSPTDYARLVLGRNKHIALSAQADALNIVEEAIQGRAARQAV